MAPTYDSDNGKIKRFGNGRIVEHIVLIVTFLLLAATGLAQKFYYIELAQQLILALGGIDATRLIHRYTGAAFGLLLGQHVLTAVIGVSLRGWQPSMLITKKDFQDAAHNVRYYIGLEHRPAVCDRYDYKEKFTYWLVLTGGMIMAFTGLALWFPIEVAKFLPGEAIPTAKALHSNEALLIFILVIVWHIYDSIFSPDVFPLDTSIFTGYIPRQRMLRLHPLELARLEGRDVEDLLGEGPEKEARGPGDGGRRPEKA